MEKEVIKVSMDMNRFGEKGTTATGEDAHEDRTSEKQGKWINQDRSYLNEVYCFNEPVMDENGKCQELKYDKSGTGKGKVHEHNFGYYKERFGASIEKQRKKYEESRHKKQAKACTVQNHYDSSKTGLQYISLQVSEKGYMNYKDREEFSKMCLDFCKSLEEEVKDASGNVIARVHCVGMTIHYDEVNAHSHHQVAFEVLDKKTGLWKPAQEEALKKLGYEPKLKETKAEKEAREEAEANGQTIEYFEGKRCNAKVAWTEQKREEWCKIVEKHLPYVKVDREAVRVKKKAKVDHEVYAGCEEVLEQMHDAKAEAREARQELEESRETKKNLEDANEDLKIENKTLEDANRSLKLNNEVLVEVGAELRQKNDEEQLKLLDTCADIEDKQSLLVEVTEAVASKEQELIDKQMLMQKETENQQVTYAEFSSAVSRFINICLPALEVISNRIKDIFKAIDEHKAQKLNAKIQEPQKRALNAVEKGTKAIEAMGKSFTFGSTGTGLDALKKTAEELNQASYTIESATKQMTSICNAFERAEEEEDPEIEFNF